MIKFKAVYGKPLLPKGFSDIDTGRALKMMLRSFMARFRNEVRNSTFSPAAKKMLTACLKAAVVDSRLTFTATHPGFAPLMLGRSKKQMTWLIKAKTPIPIITDKGELIFRSATAKSMANGSWVHPGKPSNNLLEKAKKAAKEAVKAALAKEIQKAMRIGIKK